MPEQSLKKFIDLRPNLKAASDFGAIWSAVQSL
jgi:hypothetical protein